MSKYSSDNIQVHDPVNKFYVGISKIKFKERMLEYARTDYAINHPSRQPSIVDEYIEGKDVQLLNNIEKYDKEYLEKNGFIPIEPHMDDLIVYKSSDDAVKYSLGKKGVFKIVTAKSPEEAKSLIDQEDLRMELSSQSKEREITAVFDY